MRAFELVRPKSVKEAIAARAEKPESLYKASGIDLLDLMKERLATPERLVDLSRADADAPPISVRGAHVAIRANATLADVAASKDVRASALVLADAAAQAATPQVRNRATVGGNLLQRSRCWYYRSSEFEPCLKRGGKTCFAKEGPNKVHAIFDTDAPCVSAHPSSLAPALVALGATAEIVTPGKESARTVPIAELFVSGAKPERDHALEDGEILSCVLYDASPVNRSSAFREFRERQSYDWALASASVVIDTDDAGKVSRARIVLGAVAHRPWRCEDAEKMLVGKKLDRELARAVGEKSAEGAKPLRDNAYKVSIVKTLVARALCAAAGVEGSR